MSKRLPDLYIEDIALAITRIEKYTRKIAFETFSKDSKTIDAVIRNLEIIGEAANNIPEDFAEQHPNIPWREMISMRNKVAHEYFGVDIDILWQTIKEDLPKLKIQIRNLQKQ